MEENGRQDALLAAFLRDLADGLEDSRLESPQVQMVGEFFMSYQFRTQALKDNDTSLEVADSDFEHEDMVRFFILGWFVYCVLMKNDTLTAPSYDEPEE
jgi:hypothetical protein